MDNLGAGIAIGIALGVALAAAQRRKKPGAEPVDPDESREKPPEE